MTFPITSCGQTIRQSEMAIPIQCARRYAEEHSLRPDREADPFDASPFSATVPRIQKRLKKEWLHRRTGCSGQGPTTFTHPAKSLYRRGLRSTTVVTKTSPPCLSSRQKGPTTSPPGGEGARRADEGDFLFDIKVFADRHLSCRSRGRPLIACRHFSPWGRSRSVYVGLLTVNEKMCECRRDRARA